jgi:hypothetical protein
MISNGYEDDGGSMTYRDLKDPEGCRFSSLRKILLLRFRILLTLRGWVGVTAEAWGRGERESVTVPSRCFRESVGFPQWSLNPRVGLFLCCSGVLGGHVWAVVELEKRHDCNRNTKVGSRKFENWGKDDLIRG